MTGDIREVVQGQPSLTATTLLDINAGVVLSRHGSAEAEDVSVHRLGVCAHARACEHPVGLFFFFVSTLSASFPLPSALPDSSQSTAGHPGGPRQRGQESMCSGSEQVT